MEYKGYIELNEYNGSGYYSRLHNKLQVHLPSFCLAAKQTVNVHVRLAGLLDPCPCKTSWGDHWRDH